jgi:hypothetical protein
MAWFKSEEESASDALLEIFVACSSLARQLAEHADRAPYPQVTARLREIVAQQEENLRRLSARLAVLGRNAPENGRHAIRDGRSAWERLRVSLEDYRILIRKLAQLKARWDDERPEDAALVAALRDNAVAHREVLVDLLARSDPHAHD